MEDKIQIFIRKMDGSYYSFKIKPDTKVSELKEKIVEKEGT